MEINLASIESNSARAQAEHEVALAGQAAAAAQNAAAAVLALPVPSRPITDKEFIEHMFYRLAAFGITGDHALLRARESLAAYKAAFPATVPAPK